MLSSVVIPAEGTTVVITFSESISHTTGGVSSFTITVDGYSVAATGVSVSTVTFTLTSTVSVGGGSDQHGGGSSTDYFIQREVMF